MIALFQKKEAERSSSPLKGLANVFSWFSSSKKEAAKFEEAVTTDQNPSPSKYRWTICSSLGPGCRTRMKCSSLGPGCRTRMKNAICLLNSRWHRRDSGTYKLGLLNSSASTPVRYATSSAPGYSPRVIGTPTPTYAAAPQYSAPTYTSAGSAVQYSSEYSQAPRALVYPQPGSRSVDYALHAMGADRGSRGVA